MPTATRSSSSRRGEAIWSFLWERQLELVCELGGGSRSADHPDLRFGTDPHDRRRREHAGFLALARRRPDVNYLDVGVEAVVEPVGEVSYNSLGVRRAQVAGVDVDAQQDVLASARRRGDRLM